MSRRIAPSVACCSLSVILALMLAAAVLDSARTDGAVAPRALAAAQALSNVDSLGASRSGGTTGFGGHAEVNRGSVSRNPGDLFWEDRLDVGTFEQAYDVATLKDRVFVCGFVTTPGMARDFLVRAYDASTGTLLWQDRVDKGFGDFASSVVTDQTRVFVSGNSVVPGRSQDWIVRAYAAETGGLLWEQVFDLAGRFDVTQRRALLVEGGLLYVGGSTQNASGGFAGMVRAYDASSGVLVWQDQFGGRFFDQARTFAIKAGRLFVGGVGLTDVSDDVLVRTYDARTGALLWQHRTSGFPGFGSTGARRVAVQGDRLFVGSAFETASGVEYLVQAHDTRSGALLWQDQVNKGNDADLLTDLDADQGRVFAAWTGGPRCLIDGSPPSDCDVFVRSYDGETGALLWEREFDLSGHDDQPFEVLATRGMVFVASVAALSSATGVGGWRIHAVDGSTGGLQWESIGGDVEVPLDLAYEHGRLFVPGRSVDPTTENWDWIVRAYDAQPGR